MSERIQLYAYDLSNGMAAMYGAALTGMPIEGIWHTSLVLFGMEVWYGQGIHMISPPGTTHHGTPKKRIDVGETQLDKDTFLEYLEGLRETYKADAYHLLTFNCNTFTNDVLGFLNGRQIPADIRDQPKLIMATPFGAQMRPMIEQMFVGANRASAQTAVNNILPSLGRIPPASGTATPSSSMTGTTTPVGTAQANSAASELSSNLSICTSPASLRSILASSPAVAIMFTSPSCPPCTAIKPFFEDLARRHGSPGSKKRIEFVLVEMGAGAGAEVAKSGEFGGPVQATPTFVFFVRGRKSGECKGADKRELETQVQLLEMEAFPPHPHAQLALPALDKLSHRLSPVTYTAYPPLPTLAEKLSSVLSASSVDAATGETLSKTVIAYLSSLPAPPSPALTSSLSADLISSWIAATKSSLSAISSPSDKFPIVDLLRLALARDAPRLSLQPTFIAFLPSLVSTLASDLDHDSPSRPYLLTSLRLVSNALVSPILTARLLAADTLPNITRLVIRALLDPEDAKLRAAGAGLAWSVVARVFAARVGEDAAGGRVESGVEHALGGKSEGEIGGGEEWEGEVASAVLEALGKETQSVEVVHRLSATLALLLYQSPFFTEVASLLEVLEAKDVVGRRTETVKELGGADKDAVLAVMKDLETLLSQV